MLEFKQSKMTDTKGEFVGYKIYANYDGDEWSIGTLVRNYVFENDKYHCYKPEEIIEIAEFIKGLMESKDYMKAETLAEWISTAVVDKYVNDNKSVFVASYENKQLILTCERFDGGPRVKLVWIDNGAATLLYQHIVKENYVIHSTGNLNGDHCSNENLETVWCALETKSRNNV